jgi:signal transduction histidine kinase
MIFLGHSMQYRELYESEIEMLSILLNHLVTAVDNTRLMQDKLELERRMFANEKWMSLGRLSGQIAHEVKNPLSSIKTITHVMREEFTPDSSLYQDLSVIEDEIDKLAEVVNQMLQGARPTASEEPSANIRDIVENVANVLRAEALRNNIEISCRFDDALPAIQANPVLVREIVFNVMHNGIQSIASDGTLSVSVECAEPDGKPWGPSIVIVVHDTGPGIPEESMSKIFEPFYTTKESGTGLGLWIVSEKLADLGGHISIESTEGTTVSITIPIGGTRAKNTSDTTQAVNTSADTEPQSQKETRDAKAQDTSGR